VSESNGSVCPGAARSTRSRRASLPTDIRRLLARPASDLVCADVIIVSLSHYLC
jgi:hypothetical protein